MSETDVVTTATLLDYNQLIWLAAFVFMSLSFAYQARNTRSILAVLATIAFGICAIHRVLAFIIPATMACQSTMTGCDMPEPYDTILRLSWTWHAPLFFAGALVALFFTIRKF